MKIESKFSYRIAFPLFLFIFTLSMIGFMIYNTIIDFSLEVILIYSIGLTILIPVWIWIVFGELRTKTIGFSIVNEYVHYKNFLGIGPSKKIELNMFDGYTTSNLPSKYSNSEYLYLIKNGKKLVKLSEFYHSNYFELKAIIKSKLKFLGGTSFDLLEETQEIFK